MKVFARARAAGVARGLCAAFINDDYAGVLRDRRAHRPDFISGHSVPWKATSRTAATCTNSPGFASTASSISARHSTAYAELFEPKTRETDAVSRLYQPLETLARAISDTPPRPVRADGRRAHRPAGLVKLLAVQRVNGEIDGFIGNWGMSNFYLYRFRDGRPAQLLPWDADHSFWDSRSDRRPPRHQPAGRPRDGRARPAAPYLDSSSPRRPAHRWCSRGRPRLAGTRSGSAVGARFRPAVATDPAAPFTFPEFEGNVRGLRGFLRTRPLYVECAARRGPRPGGAAVVPAAWYVEVPPP